MTQASGHTHCQVAETNAQTKTWQIVCRSPSSTDRQQYERKEGHHPKRVLRQTD